MIRIFIPGHPQTQGSKTAYPVKRRDGSLTSALTDGKTADARERLKSWRSAVADAGRDIMDGRSLLTGPIRVDVTFMMPRPKGHYRTGKNSHRLKDSAPKWHTSKRHDREKLARAVFDALTHVVWQDDGQVCSGEIEKVYGEKPGVELAIRELEG